MPNKILIVDDEEIVIRTIKRMFRKYDYEFLEASNGIDGLDAIASDAPDIGVILLDYIMPGMNGYQFSERLHNLITAGECPDIPVIGIGDFYPEDQKRYLKTCHPKPIDMDHLAVDVNEYFRVA